MLSRINTIPRITRTITNSFKNSTIRFHPLSTINDRIQQNSDISKVKKCRFFTIH